MKISLKWPVIIITFFITFFLIYAANYWRQQNLVMQPLREQLLALDAVDDVRIEGEREKQIFITLGAVPRLSDAYGEIEGVLQSCKGGESSQITIIDRRNPYLSALFDKIHFALMEGERQGNYTQMHTEIQNLLAGEEELLDYFLSVDQERIYLQLSTADHFLYEIIPIKNNVETAKADR